jgi:hypothetical protein
MKDGPKDGPVAILLHGFQEKNRRDYKHTTSTAAKAKI